MATLPEIDHPCLLGTSKFQPDQQVMEVIFGGRKIGITVKGPNCNGKGIFIPNIPGQSMDDFAAFVRFMQMGQIEVVDGSVFLIRDCVRSLVIEVGRETDANNDQTNPRGKSFTMPTKFQRRLNTLATKDDSPGKIAWRQALRESFHEVFNDPEKMPDENACVLFFPGILDPNNPFAGREIGMWHELGFKEENMILIEKDPVLAEELRLRLPKALVIEADLFKSPTRVFKIILHDIFHEGKTLAVINIDPENHISERAHKALERLEEMIRQHGPGPKYFRKCLLSINLGAGRENQELQNVLKRNIPAKKEDLLAQAQELYGSLPDDATPENLATDLNLLRYLEVKGLTHAFQPYGYYSFEKGRSIRSGRYQGNGGEQRYFTIFELNNSRYDKQ